MSGSPASSIIIRYSTFSVTVTVGSNQTVEADSAFWNNAGIVSVRASAASTTTYSVQIYSSSTKTAPNLLTSYSASTYAIPMVAYGEPGMIYRDADGNNLLHWSVTNKDRTSTVVLTAYYGSA